MKPLLALLPALLLCACASGPKPYGAARGGDAGYTERFIENDRARITYVDSDRGAATDYALLRAAELAVERGFTHFEVVREDTLAVDTGRTGRRGGIRPSVGVGVGTGRRVGGIGVGGGISIPIPIGGGGGSDPALYEREIEVIFRNGPGTNNAYEARDVLESFRR